MAWAGMIDSYVHIYVHGQTSLEMICYFWIVNTKFSIRIQWLINEKRDFFDFSFAYRSNSRQILFTLEAGICEKKMIG